MHRKPMLSADKEIKIPKEKWKETMGIGEYNGFRKLWHCNQNEILLTAIVHNAGSENNTQQQTRSY